MKHFFLQNKGLHCWLFASGAVLLLFFVLRQSRTLATAFAERVTLPFARSAGRACAALPFSAAEACYVLLVPVALICIVLAVRYLMRAQHKGRALYRAALFFADAALTVYAVFCLLWGINYYADDFCDRSGLTSEPVALEELTRVTQYFADQLTACADAAPRDGEGCFSADRAAIIDAAPDVYATLYEEFPFLVENRLVPKAFYFSKVLSAMNFTGFYFPFTGEANVNVDSPASMLPCTALHEMTHQQGVASEQQCNFLAILGCMRAQDAAYRYSGCLTGYIHLSNALYRADREAWRAMRDALPESVLRDLAQNSAYWAQYEGFAADAAQALNDRMIRSYGDALGTQSYGAVVDLLVAYYR